MTAPPRMAVTTLRSLNLTGNEVGMLKALVRGEWRKTMRRQEKGREKFGAEYDPSAHDDRLAFLEGLYRRFGGVPERLHDERLVDHIISEEA